MCMYVSGVAFIVDVCIQKYGWICIYVCDIVQYKQTTSNIYKKSLTTKPMAAAGNGGGVNRERQQTGQRRLFSHQLHRLRDVKHTTKELHGERAGRWQGVRVLSPPKIRILCRRERKVVCWGQRATMSCYTFKRGKKASIFQSQLFLTSTSWWFLSFHIFFLITIHHGFVLFCV